MEDNNRRTIHNTVNLPVLPKVKMADDSTPTPRSDSWGYPGLAKHMGLYPERAIFSRFSDLTARNLSYYQAELTELKLTLFAHEGEDVKDIDVTVKERAVNWETLSKDPLWLRLRLTLEKYG